MRFSRRLHLVVDKADAEAVESVMAKVLGVHGVGSLTTLEDGTIVCDVPLREAHYDAIMADLKVIMGEKSVAVGVRADTRGVIEAVHCELAQDRAIRFDDVKSAATEALSARDGLK